MIALIPGLSMRWWLILVVLMMSLARASLGAFLVVFAHGGFLEVEKVELVDTQRLRLHLPAGAMIEVPLVRVERVLETVEAAVGEKGKPSFMTEGCAFAFSPEPLPKGTPFAAEILAAAAKHNVHPRLVAAVVEAESGFNPFAVSPMGARGLMQLMPSLWLASGLLDPHNPKENLEVGTKHLRWLLDHFQKLDLALAAYNAGVAVVESYGGMPPFRETQNYVKVVLERFCSQGKMVGL